MNIRNLNLLTGIQERINQLIENKTEKETIDSDSVAQIMANFVKLGYIDYENFQKLENFFMIKAEKNGIKNKETIYSILVSHSQFMNKIYNEVKKKHKGIKAQKEYK